MSRATARKSGRTSNKFLGAICPTSSTRPTRRSFKAEIIFESWPTLSRTMSSTNAASSGEVSFEGNGHEPLDARSPCLPGKDQRQRAVFRDDANSIEFLRHKRT